MKMKKIKEFIKRDIAGETVLVPTGATAQEYNGMMTLEGIGGFVWDHIEEADSLDDLAAMITNEYEVDSETAKKDVKRFIQQLIDAGMVVPETPGW